MKKCIICNEEIIIPKSHKYCSEKCRIIGKKNTNRLNFKNWLLKNKDIRQEYMDEWWEKNREKQKEYNKSWRKNNREKNIAWWAEYRIKNKIKINQRNKNRYLKYTDEEKNRIKIKSNIWRQQRKINLVNLFGGKCQICDYNKCIRALEFHHKIPKNKRSLNWEREYNKILNNKDNFQLLCSNCHREVEDEKFKGQHD
jgi:hypothetical protein